MTFIKMIWREVPIWIWPIIIMEIYYWFFWFPKAWRTGATREIRHLKYGMKVLSRYYKEP